MPIKSVSLMVIKYERFVLLALDQRQANANATETNGTIEDARECMVAGDGP